jgi:hypothetical protein
MAPGDAQRVWFPEMVETLRSQWHHGISFEATIELRDGLDAMLQQIRSDRHIRTPVFRCPHCGHVGEGAQPHVSVRAMLLSLVRFGIADAEQIKTLESVGRCTGSRINWIFLGKVKDSHLPKRPDAAIHKSDKPTTRQGGSDHMSARLWGVIVLRQRYPSQSRPLAFRFREWQHSC